MRLLSNRKYKVTTDIFVQSIHGASRLSGLVASKSYRQPDHMWLAAVSSWGLGVRIESDQWSLISQHIPRTCRSRVWTFSYIIGTSVTVLSILVGGLDPRWVATRHPAQQQYHGLWK
eukprot:2241469-Amphidinium_carterae.1